MSASMNSSPLGHGRGERRAVVAVPSAVPQSRPVRRRAPSPRSVRQPTVYWSAVLGTALVSVLAVGGLIAALFLRSHAPAVVVAAPQSVTAAPAAPAVVAHGPIALPPSIPQPSLAPPAEIAAPTPLLSAGSAVVQAGWVGEPVAKSSPAPAAPSPEPAETAPASVCALGPTTQASQPAYETFGTRIHFLSSPEAAAQQALRENKLLFVLHIAGNFEDDKFT